MASVPREFSEIVRTRYATKSFDGKRIDEATMQKLLELIRLAPSSVNLQPWRIKVISDQATKEALSPHSWNQKQITTCSHLLVFCADTKLEERMAAMVMRMKASEVSAENIEGFSRMVGGMLTRMDGPQRLIWAQKQCYIAMSHALLGAKSLGLDSCPMEGFVPSEYSRVLKLPAHLVPTLVVPVGYPNDKPWPKVRFEKKDVFF